MTMLGAFRFEGEKDADDNEIPVDVGNYVGGMNILSSRVLTMEPFHIHIE